MGFVHEPVKAAGAIEQGKLGVQMQMNKIGVRHVFILRCGGWSASLLKSSKRQHPSSREEPIFKH
jgi:hypothetical protein